MYSVYLNDQHFELDESCVGIRIGDKLFTAPTQADDLLLLSLTKTGTEILRPNKFSIHYSLQDTYIVTTRSKYITCNKLVT